MKTLLELREEEKDARVNHTGGGEYPKRMFIDIGENCAFIINGWFLDPFLNLIEPKDMPGRKTIYFSDVEMSKIQADYVE